MEIRIPDWIAELLPGIPVNPSPVVVQQRGPDPLVAAALGGLIVFALIKWAK